MHASVPLILLQTFHCFRPVFAFGKRVDVSPKQKKKPLVTSKKLKRSSNSSQWCLPLTPENRASETKPSDGIGNSSLELEEMKTTLVCRCIDTFNFLHKNHIDFNKGMRPENQLHPNWRERFSEGGYLNIWNKDEYTLHLLRKAMP